MIVFKNKTILITGGTGSWGYELTKQLLKKDPKKIIIFSRGELAQVTMERFFKNKKLEFVIGDIRDEFAVDFVMSKNIDYVTHCFPKGTEVICEDTVKYIEDIKIGDKIFSSDGKINEVSDLIRREYNEDIIEIKAYHSNIKIRSTTEHPYLIWKPSKKCSKTCRTKCTPACNNKNKGSCPEHYKKDNPKWVMAEDIEKGDFIAIPRIKIKTTTTDYSENMMRLFGYYLAEGCLREKNKKNGNYYGITFTFNSNEENYLKDVENILYENFGKYGSRYYSKTNSCAITICGKDIASKFIEFGIGSENMKIPSWVFKLDDNKKIEQLLLGYFRGDGCYSNGKITTVSKILAYQLRLLFGILGIPTGFDYYKCRGFKNDGIGNDQYQISISKINNNSNFFVSNSKNSFKTFITDDYIFYLVKEVERKKDKLTVYNLTVDGDHTYNVHGYAVHNCAALKHVPICENHPQEAIKTNIIGTTNLVNSAIKYKVKKFIDVSTDKAVSPTNLYGFTKATGEKIVIQANNLTQDTDFVCVRGGNVLGSNGSVVPLFIDQIKKNNKITLTCSDMTRFFLTLPEAISLLFQAIENSNGGETFVMNMPAFYIVDIADVLIEKYGNNETTIEEIGIREGEKLDEVLISEHESCRSYIFNKDFFIILSDLKIDRDYKHKLLPKVNFTRFSSATNIKPTKDIENLLIKGGY